MLGTIIHFILSLFGLGRFWTLETDHAHQGGTFTSVPDTPSPIFPERLIRPLPKRLLRERLSHEAAESIFYPPAPQSSSPIFYSPYNENDSLNDAKVHVQQNLPDYVSDYTHDGHVYDDELDSGEEDGPILVRRRDNETMLMEQC